MKIGIPIMRTLSTQQKYKFIVNFLINESLAKGYYLTDSAHYDFVAFGAVSPLTKYTFLKGTIDYKDSIFINNKFNLQALQGEEITTSEFLKIASP